MNDYPPRMNNLRPPLLSLRRDPHFSQARRISAAFFAVVQAAWFIAFVLAIQAGTELTFPVIILGLAGVFLIAAKGPVEAELALGWVDHRAGLFNAPLGGEILRRILTELLLPFALLAGGFAGRHSPAIIAVSITAIVIVELVVRLFRVRGWTNHRIHPEVLKALLLESPGRAVEALAGVEELTSPELETSVLAISGIAIREGRSQALRDLEELLASKSLPKGDEELLERTTAVLRADRFRLENLHEAAPHEAEALRLAPPGHPRRLALALFVSTAALDQEDPASAIKALHLLHTRDIAYSSGRVLVNWLLMEAARQTGDTSLTQRCRDALKTYNTHREVLHLSTEKLDPKNDPYARWIKRAIEGLKGKGSTEE